MFSYEVLQSFNNLEMLVYNYVMEHRHEVQYMTIRELAEAVHVSTSTVVRFCKKAGCDGYSEFRVQFKMFLKEEKEHKSKARMDESVDELTNFFRTVTSTRYEEQMNEYDLTLFIREASGLYRREQELHDQRGYEITTVCQALERAGMRFVTVLDADTMQEPTDFSERIYVVAREHGKKKGTEHV